MQKVIAIGCDLEYSTLYDKVGGDVLEMGFVEILEDFTLGRRMSRKSKATNPMYFNDESVRVHGFSYWTAVKFPERKKSILDVLHWLAPIKDLFPLPLVCHANGKSDWKWLEAHFFKEDLHCSLYRAFPEDLVENTIKMARDNIKHIKESVKINPITDKIFTKYSLQNVADHYGIEFNNHDALSDTLTCAQIWCNIKQKKDTWTGELAL